MKKFAILVLAVSLTACTWFSGTDKSGESQLSDNVKLGYSQVDPVGEGDICGGKEKTPCAQGLMCGFDYNEKLATGTCFKSVADEKIECDKEDQTPVCGLRAGQKQTYLNKCELGRHGAEFLNDGFCEINIKNQGKCNISAVGIGTCFTSVSGYEFTDGKCREKFVAGCQAEIPFKDLAECETTCK